MNNTILFYIILAGVVSFALAFLMYGSKARVPKKLKPVLLVLRFFTWFSLLLLLINPRFQQTSYRVEKPQLPVLIDNSASVSHLQQDQRAALFISQIKDNKELNDKFDVSYYTFGEDIALSDSLTFDARNTNISKPLNSVNELFRDQVAPIVLVTDGNQTVGADYEFTAIKVKNSVFPIILGDSIKHRDLKIEQLNSNRYAYLKNKFPVEVIISGNTSENVNSEFTISKNGNVVYRAPVSFSEETQTVTLSFHLPAETVGLQKYMAEIRPLADEKNSTNNKKPFAVEVIDQATNVLIVSSMTHPDIGALKRAITANEQRKVSIKKPAEAMAELEDYQLIILFQPDPNFAGIFRQLSKIRKNYWIFAGQQTNWRALNGYQKYFHKTTSANRDLIQGVVDRNYSSFAVDDIGFSGFPPLYTVFGNTDVQEGAQTILKQAINGYENGNPLLITIEDSDSRVGLWDGEGFWRWRAASFRKEENFEKFDDFIGRMVQYLASNKKRERLEVMAETFYYNNKPLKITVQFFDKNYVFDPRANLSITVKNSNTEKEQTFPLLLRNNFYEVDLGNLEEGDYSYTVSVENESDRKVGNFSVLDFDVEQQFLNADVAKLQRIASHTGGTSFFVSESDKLMKQLVEDDRFKSIQKEERKTQSLIDWKYLLAIIVLLLSAEWFIRKYNGLI